MSGISGSCGENLASQLFQQGMEHQTTQRLEQQRQLQQETLERLRSPRPGQATEPGQPDSGRAAPSIEGLKGALLDTYA